MENFRFGMTKVYSEIPPHGKLQIWDAQSLLRNTPPWWKTSDLGCPKFTPKYPPPHGNLQIWDAQSLLRNTPLWWKTSDLGWPKFTPKYPPMENFRFGMTKVYSEITPPWKTSDLGCPKFTPKYPPLWWKTSDLGWPKFTPKYPPHGKLQIWDAQSLLWNTPPPNYGKLQIWDDQSLLRNTPPPWKTSDLGWPKFTSKYPPWKTSDLGCPKFTPKYPPNYGKLQIWDDQSLLRNTPLPPWKTSDLGWPKFTPKYPPPNNRKLSESSSLRFSEHRELLHVETLSNRDNY